MKTNKVRAVEQEAIRFREWHGLGSSEPIPFGPLFMRLGVIVVFRTLSDKFCGMSIKGEEQRNFMLINSSHTIGRQHFTMAHELYHLFVEDSPKTHRCLLEDGSRNPVEQHANMFASVLLLPENGILQMLSKEEAGSKKEVSLATILRMEEYFGVSRQALLNRLLNLGFITKERRAELLTLSPIDTAKAYGFDTSMYLPSHDGLVIGDYGAKAFMLFELEQISEGHYRELISKLYKVKGNGEDQDSTGCRRGDSLHQGRELATSI